MPIPGLAFKAVLGVDTIRLYDINSEATTKAINNLSNQELEIVPCQSPHEAIEGAQIITTCIAAKQFARY